MEYAETPSASQLRWAGLMIDAGATLVIGKQSHVVQPVEVFAAPDGSAARGGVAYELGNFVFDQGHWRTPGMLFEATFEGRRLAGWRLRPIHILSLYQPTWPDKAEAQAIPSRVEAASTVLPSR